MHKKNLIKIILKLIIIIVLCSNLQNVNKVFASEFSFYNHNTKSNVNYNGKLITFVFNNKNISLEHPGIILNGTAFADYEELFVKELGLSATISDKKIIISDGATEITFTVGSKKVNVNGKSQKVSTAPVKLEFEEGIIKYYVPTRFVSETFGYSYVWDSENSEIRLTKASKFVIDDKNIQYNDIFYSLTYNNKTIIPDLPVLNYKHTVYAPAKVLFDALECVYSEEEKIYIKKDNIYIQMESGSYQAFVNDIPFEMNAKPLYISSPEKFNQMLYIPLEETIKLLGYSLEFEEYTYHILPTKYTGKPEQHPDLKKYYNTITTYIDPKPLETYFQWSAKENIKIPGFKNLTKVKAYSIENADVLELYGITRNDVYDYIDTRALVFELNSVSSNFDTNFYANFEALHFNYALIANVNRHTKIFMMIPENEQWLFEETEECLRVYFASSEFSVNDLKIKEEKTVKNIPAFQNTSYPENRLIVPLPDEVTAKSITVFDNYFENKLQINIPGNHLDYFNNNSPINPYEYVTDIEIIYDIETSNTILNCTTSYICGYEIINNDSYFSLRIDKPAKIYNKILVLDAGHGGKDPGAVNNTIYEKNINLSIINYASKLFDNTDIKVYCTRINDKFLSLEERTGFVKDVEADLFVSLHMNASELEAAKGTEVFYSKANNEETYYGLTSKKMAQILADKMHLAMESNLRGVSKSEYYVVHYNSVPAVLIELGFISNLEECSKLTDKKYQQKAAEAIYNSMVDIFGAYPTGR